MQKQLIETNPVLKLSFEFSLGVIDYCEQPNKQKKFVLSNQLLRSGTSIGANAFEAQNAESKADFIHKMKIAAKEADETQYGLMLCDFSNTSVETTRLLQQLDALHKILNKILSTSRKKMPFSYMLSFFI